MSVAMTADELRAAVLRVLCRVVPGTDPAALAPDVGFRDQLDMDSIDFLNFVIGIHEALGVAIPERDYPRFATLADAVTYLQAARPA